MNKQITYLDKIPPKKERFLIVKKKTINGFVYPEKVVERLFRRKIICSGPPMNPIDIKMRKKYGRKTGKPVIKYYEVKI